MRRIAILAIALAALSLVAAGAFLAFQQPKSGDEIEPEFVVALPVQDVGVLPAGDHIVPFEVTNPSKQARRIIGLSQACTRNCCFRAAFEDPVWVGAGQTVRYECQIKVHAAGEFEAPMTLFLEDHGIRKVELMVRGVGYVPQE